MHKTEPFSIDHFRFHDASIPTKNGFQVVGVCIIGAITDK